MKTYLFLKRAVLVGSVVLIPWLLPGTNHAADQIPEGTTAPVSAEVLGKMAAGAVGDTMKACLARIPNDSSAGQRMLAEQSCTQDEGTRKLSQAAPQF